MGADHPKQAKKDLVDCYANRQLRMFWRSTGGYFLTFSNPTCGTTRVLPYRQVGQSAPTSKVPCRGATAPPGVNR